MSECLVSAPVWVYTCDGCGVTSKKPLPYRFTDVAPYDNDAIHLDACSPACLIVAFAQARFGDDASGHELTLHVRDFENIRALLEPK